MRYGLDMGSVFLHLDAEVNWYREFHNLISGFSQKEVIPHFQTQIHEVTVI